MNQNILSSWLFNNTEYSWYQKRCFGKGLKRTGKKHGYTNDEVKLQICYSDYDLDFDKDFIDSDIEDMTFARVRFDMLDIKETVEEIFDDSRNMEYYDDYKQQWKPFRDLQNMQQYRGGKHVLKVRVPDHYDDTPMELDENNNIIQRNVDVDDNDDENLNVDNDNNDAATAPPATAQL